MMTQRGLLAMLLAFSLTPFGRSAIPETGQAASQTLPPESDRAALLALVDRFSHAVNSKDAKALAACFTEDGEFTNPVGMSAKGRTAIEAFHAGLFAPVRLPHTPSFYNARLEVLSSSLRMLRPDVATIDVRWKQDGAIAPDGSPWGTRMGILSWVAVRDHGTWSIAVWHNLELPH